MSIWYFQLARQNIQINNSRKYRFFLAVKSFPSSLFSILLMLFPHCNFSVFQELRMYNPAYLERPYVVVLNKIDLPEVCSVGANMWVKCYLLVSFYLEKGWPMHHLDCLGRVMYFQEICKIMSHNKHFHLIIILGKGQTSIIDSRNHENWQPWCSIVWWNWHEGEKTGGLS